MVEETPDVVEEFPTAVQAIGKGMGEGIGAGAQMLVRAYAYLALIVLLLLIPPLIGTIVAHVYGTPYAFCVAGLFWWVWLTCMHWGIDFFRTQVREVGRFLVDLAGTHDLIAACVRFSFRHPDEVGSRTLSIVATMINFTTARHVAWTLAGHAAPAGWVWVVAAPAPALAKLAGRWERKPANPNQGNAQRPGTAHFLEVFFSRCSLATSLAVLAPGLPSAAALLYAYEMFNTWAQVFPPLATAVVFAGGRIIPLTLAMHDSLGPVLFLGFLGVAPPLPFLLGRMAATKSILWFQEGGDHWALLLLAGAVLPYTLAGALLVDSRLWLGLGISAIIWVFKPLVTLAMRLVAVVLVAVVSLVLALIVAGLVSRWYFVPRQPAPESQTQVGISQPVPHKSRPAR